MPAAKRSAPVVAVRNVNVPGATRHVDAAKYEAMRKALLKTLPKKAPGLTQSEMFDRVKAHLPDALFPGGAKAEWWAKTVQLDLEAKGVLARDAGRPLRWLVADDAAAKPAEGSIPVVRLSESNGPRPIRFLGLWKHAGWRVKLYGIRYRGEKPDAELVARAKEIARGTLPSPATGGNRYGVAFVGVHQGRGADFVFVDWWQDENELHHVVHHTRPPDRKRLLPAGPDSPTACVWDVRVQAFERDAWVETVLRNPKGPDLGAYLAPRLDGEG